MSLSPVFPSSGKLSYPELEVFHPLSHHLILWGGGVGQLELEQVIASWSVAVLVEHNRGAGTACTDKREKMQQKGQQGRNVLDGGVTDWIQQLL